MSAKTPRHTAAGKTATALILEIFRVNGRLLAAGDALVAGLGLTSARWQVLGAVALAPSPQPVARLARGMGLSRQAVQRLADELAADGILAFADNPHHRRAKLVVPTEAGKRLYRATERRQVPWINGLGGGLDPTDIAAAARVLSNLRERLERAAGNAVEPG